MNRTSFPIRPDQANHEAHEFLESVLESLPDSLTVPEYYARKEPPSDEIRARIDDAGPQFQILLLKACLERMSWLRQLEEDTFLEGSVVYDIYSYIFRNKHLPVTEHDVCDLLRFSKHTCGHGDDVQWPFNLMVEYGRRNGLSDELLAATRTYVDGLKGTGGIKANNVKRKAALVLLLDPGSKKKKCVKRFSPGFQCLSASERRAWVNFFLNMAVNDVHKPNKAWKKHAETLVEALGEEKALSNLRDWWPSAASDDSGQSVTTGESHLLKNWLWLLQLLSNNYPVLRETCDDLVCKLASVHWKPAERGQKVMVACALYLIERPPEVAAEPLISLLRSSRSIKSSGSRIKEAADEYVRRHTPEQLQDDERA